VVSNSGESADRFRAPPPQQNLQRAVALAFEQLGGQADEQMIWLGAESSHGVWRLPVLDDVFGVDLAAGNITTSSGGKVGIRWSIFTLHYLATTSRPERQAPQTTFADLPVARSYAGVYRARVVSRLCGTVGRDGETLRAAATSLGGHPVTEGDAAFDFAVFPRLSVRLIWYAPDEEFPPSATLLLPGNIDSYLCAEDIVVLSESLVSRLCGRPF